MSNEFPSQNPVPIEVLRTYANIQILPEKLIKESETQLSNVQILPEHLIKESEPQQLPNLQTVAEPPNVEKENILDEARINGNVVIDINSFDIPEEVSNTNSEFENMGNANNFQFNDSNSANDGDIIQDKVRGIRQAFSSQSPQSSQLSEIHKMILEERRKRLRTQHENEIIENLRQHQNESGESGEDEFDARVGCTICMCNFEENDMITAFNCNHRFHTKEAREWLALKRVCPSCFRPADDMRHYIYKSMKYLKPEKDNTNPLIQHEQDVEEEEQTQMQNTISR